MIEWAVYVANVFRVDLLGVVFQRLVTESLIHRRPIFLRQILLRDVVRLEMTRIRQNTQAPPLRPRKSQTPYRRLRRNHIRELQRGPRLARLDGVRRSHARRRISRANTSVPYTDGRIIRRQTGRNIILIQPVNGQIMHTPGGELQRGVPGPFAQVIYAHILPLDPGDQGVRLIPEELDTGDRLGAGELPQRLDIAFRAFHGQALADVPDVQAKIIAHAVQAGGQQSMRAESDGIAVSLVANRKGEGLLGLAVHAQDGRIAGRLAHGHERLVDGRPIEGAKGGHFGVRRQHLMVESLPVKRVDLAQSEGLPRHVDGEKALLRGGRGRRPANSRLHLVSCVDLIALGLVTYMRVSAHARKRHEIIFEFLFGTIQTDVTGSAPWFQWN